MAEDYTLQIQNIKRRLRLAMNGVVSTNMRERGLDYKLNFGVALPTLRKMAVEYGKNHELAQRLWAENIRELRILASFIQPVESFTPELAFQWVESIAHPEMAEQCSMNLFQHLSYAHDLVVDLLTSQTEMARYTAWHLLARLTARGTVFADEEFRFLIDQAIIDLQSDRLNLFNGALLGLKRLGAKNKHLAENILVEIERMSEIDCDKKQQIYDDLKFEYDYYLQTPL